MFSTLEIVPEKCVGVRGGWGWGEEGFRNRRWVLESFLLSTPPSLHYYNVISF